MESKFYISQRIVAIRDHTRLEYKKGDEFQVLDIKKGCCQSIIKINNNVSDANYCYCSSCKKTSVIKYSSFYYNEENFAPIQDISDFTYEEALELVCNENLIEL